MESVYCGKGRVEHPSGPTSQFGFSAQFVAMPRRSRRSVNAQLRRLNEAAGAADAVREASTIDRGSEAVDGRQSQRFWALSSAVPDEVGSPHWTISATVDVGLRPAKGDENRRAVTMAGAGAARPNRASGAIEAEQLFGPERA
jgi:hypothetical protein